MALIKNIAIHSNSLLFDQEHFWSNIGITSGPESFAVLGSFADLYNDVVHSCYMYESNKRNLLVEYTIGIIITEEIFL